MKSRLLVFVSLLLGSLHSSSEASDTASKPVSSCDSIVIIDTTTFFNDVDCYRREGNLNKAYAIFFSSAPSNVTSGFSGRRYCEISTELLNSFVEVYPSTGDAGAQKSALGRTCADFGYRPDQILWDQGQKSFNQKDYAKAKKYFVRIRESYPRSDYAGRASAYERRCENNGAN